MISKPNNELGSGMLSGSDAGSKSGGSEVGSTIGGTGFSGGRRGGGVPIVSKPNFKRNVFSRSSRVLSESGRSAYSDITKAGFPAKFFLWS